MVIALQAHTYKQLKRKLQMAMTMTGEMTLEHLRRRQMWLKLSQAVRMLNGQPQRHRLSHLSRMPEHLTSAGYSLRHTSSFCSWYAISSS
jgi:hypothetical protein